MSIQLKDTVLDNTTFIEFSSLLERSDLVHFLEVFNAELSARADQLSTDTSRREFESVGFSAHKIASGFSAIGAYAQVDMAREIEDLAKKESLDMKKIDHLLSEIKKCINQIEIVINDVKR